MPIKSEERRRLKSARDTKESRTSCGRKDSVKQMVSGLLAAAWIERSVWFEFVAVFIYIHIIEEKCHSESPSQLRDTIRSLAEQN